jgi:SAM-dependent methyltransferase
MPLNALTYAPGRYWERQHGAADDERAVGHPDLARSLNRSRYDVERRNVVRALEQAGAERPDRVLDVGSGTGIWIDFWAQRGASEIIGVDLARAAVERLRARYPGRAFHQLDVSDPKIRLPGDLDVVSAMSVLLHITDEARFEHALRNLLGCLRVGGLLVLVEPAIVHRWWGPPFGPGNNSRARTLTTYERILRVHGFELVAVRPASCLLTNVIDTRHRTSFVLLDHYWRALGLIVGRRERLGRVAGSILRSVDLIATKLARTGPSAKVIIARRTTDAAGQCVS